MNACTHARVAMPDGMRSTMVIQGWVKGICRDCGEEMLFLAQQPGGEDRREYSPDEPDSTSTYSAITKESK